MTAEQPGLPGDDWQPNDWVLCSTDEPPWTCCYRLDGMGRWRYGDEFVPSEHVSSRNPVLIARASRPTPAAATAHDRAFALAAVAQTTGHTSGCRCDECARIYALGLPAAASPREEGGGGRERPLGWLWPDDEPPLTLRGRDRIVRAAMGEMLPDWRGDRDVRLAESVIDKTLAALPAAPPAGVQVDREAARLVHDDFLARARAAERIGSSSPNAERYSGMAVAWAAAAAALAPLLGEGGGA